MATLRARSSGILFHPSSLSGPDGIGDLGLEAHRFAESLAAAGQSWWQMLPVGPVAAGNSPYSSPSSFAGNPLLISLKGLVEEGLLRSGDFSAAPKFSENRVDYEAVRRFKEPLLVRAFENYRKRRKSVLRRGFEEFCAAHKSWLDDYALFCALKELAGPDSWLNWSAELRLRQFEKWDPAFSRRAQEIALRHRFIQYLFHRQWEALRRRCRELGISLIGDVPIFVALDSADVWAHSGIFQLDAELRPLAVSGVPPDYFSATGQLWGNPLYRWDVLRERGYDWWISRLRQTAERFDAVRLDHFIGFSRYWEIPAQAHTAVEGRWVPGPGENFLEIAKSRLGSLELIAEDLGVVTPEVEALRDRFELPGMRVLQFAFWTGVGAQEGLPDKFPRRCVVYTGTHDNDTVAGWFAGLKDGEKEVPLRYLGTDGREIHWDMIAAALKSPGDTAVIPAQDLLGLGSEARMNRPSTAEGNWEWRLAPGALSPEILARLRRLTEESRRLPPAI